MRFTTTLKTGQSPSKRYNPCIKLLDLMNGQLHLPAALSPTRNSTRPTECGDGWVNISGLDALYKRKPLAFPATANRIVICLALIPGSAMITQPFSGIKFYAGFLGPYTKRWNMLYQEVHGHFLYNFRQYTYLLTPWSRVLEKLTGSAASQEIPRIFGTRRFITLLTSARHLSLSSANSIQSPQPPPTS